MLMRVGRSVIAALLVWALVPGSAEMSEQLVHLLRNGHLAHSIPGDPDEVPPGAEHGCQGAMHLCRCCPSSIASATQFTLVSPLVALATAMDPLRRSHGDPHLLNVYRPPRA